MSSPPVTAESVKNGLKFEISGRRAMRPFLDRVTDPRVADRPQTSLAVLDSMKAVGQGFVYATLVASKVDARRAADRVADSDNLFTYDPDGQPIPSRSIRHLLHERGHSQELPALMYYGAALLALTFSGGRLLDRPLAEDRAGGTGQEEVFTLPLDVSETAMNMAGKAFGLNPARPIQSVTTTFYKSGAETEGDPVFEPRLRISGIHSSEFSATIDVSASLHMSLTRRLVGKIETSSDPTARMSPGLEAWLIPITQADKVLDIALATQLG